jgi:serine/threonine protein kinase
VFVGRRHDDRRFDRSARWAVAALSSAMASVCEREVISGDAADNDAGFECPACGIVSASRALLCACGREPVAAALPGRLAGQFVLVRRLGAGAAGVVYLARDAALGRFVALKTLPELRVDALERLRDEARAMAALSHETLATIYGVHVWRRTPVLIVEAFEQTLDRRLATGPVDPRAVVSLGVRIARALAHMHGRGVLHRDVKPSNIGLTAEGQGKLLDFGLATVMSCPEAGALDDDVVAGRVRIAGTPAYLPPETFRGTPPSPAFDLWALAVTLLECTSGSNPFAPPRAEIMRGISERRLRRFCKRRVPAPLRPFFERALAFSPERRFHDAAEMLRELERLLATL